jgi:hypothetical protein
MAKFEQGIKTGRMPGSGLRFLTLSLKLFDCFNDPAGGEA